MWELLQRAFAAAASASSSNKNNSRHFVVVYEQLWGAECPRRVSTVASCLARFVFRGVRQQQNVLASLLACARCSAYAAASVDVSVARSTQCGRCQRRQQTKQLVANRCLSKMPVALLLGFSPFLSRSLPPSLFFSASFSCSLSLDFAFVFFLCSFGQIRFACHLQLLLHKYMYTLYMSVCVFVCVRAHL